MITETETPPPMSLFGSDILFAVWYSIYVNIKIIYTALFVDDIPALLKKFPPKHSKIFGHHSTISVRPASLEGIEVGERSRIKIIGRVFDEKGDALLVENPKSGNKYPHITLSCAKEIAPTYSGQLIENFELQNSAT